MALSSRSLALGVTQQPDLHGSPDFPQNISLNLSHDSFRDMFRNRTLTLLTYYYDAYIAFM